MHLLARYGDPRALLRLGRARLAQFLIRHSHGQWRHDKADHLLAVACGTLQLWDGEGIDFDQLGADLAIEADQALMLTAQVRRLDERTTRSVRRGRPRPDRPHRPRRRTGPGRRDHRPPGRPAPVHQPGRDPLGITVHLDTTDARRPLVFTAGGQDDLDQEGTYRHVLMPVTIPE